MHIAAFLARATAISRRRALEIVKSGIVAVNGSVVRGGSIDPETDAVTVDGRSLHAPAPLVFCMHKPLGIEVSLSGSQNRKMRGGFADRRNSAKPAVTRAWEIRNGAARRQHRRDHRESRCRMGDDDEENDGVLVVATTTSGKTTTIGDGESLDSLDTGAKRRGKQGRNFGENTVSGSENGGENRGLKKAADIEICGGWDPHPGLDPRFRRVGDCDAGTILAALSCGSIDDRGPRSLVSGPFSRLFSYPKTHLPRETRAFPTLGKLVAPFALERGCFPSSRLDVWTSGLVVLTNDGALSQRLSHPSMSVRKRYLAIVRGGTLSRDAVDAIEAAGKVSRMQEKARHVLGKNGGKQEQEQEEEEEEEEERVAKNVLEHEGKVLRGKGGEMGSARAGKRGIRSPVLYRERDTGRSVRAAPCSILENRALSWTDLLDPENPSAASFLPGLPIEGCDSEEEKGVLSRKGKGMREGVDVAKLPQVSLVRLEIASGAKRYVRRALLAVGHPVICLKREAVGDIHLGDLSPGEARRIATRDVKDFFM